MNIPFVDLLTQYLNIKGEIDSAIGSVISETAFIGGKYSKKFEGEFAAKLGVKHCIGVANGTDAIYIVLKMMGVKEGDEVITVANSWISTSETISQTGAKPVFVDIDPNYYTIDVNKIEEKITSRTKAIIPVHIYGQIADIDRILEIARKHNLFVIEDCAQSHLSELKGKIAGTSGLAGTFSFYPGKNLGAYGDAGAVITNEDKLAEKVRMYANHGALTKHQHQIEGINSRLDGLQGAILSVKLKYLAQWTESRINNSRIYNELLKNIDGITLPTVRPESKHTFHLYVIRTKKRKELQEFLKNRGVETAIHYPTALPLLPAYSYLNHKPSDFPVASVYQNEILSLPMYPELTSQQIEYVCDSVKEFFDK